MKNYDNCKIKLYYERHFNDSYRIFYWKIDPKEFNLWDRIFLKNPWRIFKRAVKCRYNVYYSLDKYEEHLKNIVTYKDAVQYQREQYEKVTGIKHVNWGF